MFLSHVLLFPTRACPTTEAALGHSVWLDLDADGVRGVSEEGASGVAVAAACHDGRYRTATETLEGDYSLAVPLGQCSVTARVALRRQRTPAPFGNCCAGALFSPFYPNSGKREGGPGSHKVLILSLNLPPPKVTQDVFLTDQVFDWVDSLCRKS